MEREDGVFIRVINSAAEENKLKSQWIKQIKVYFASVIVCLGSGDLLGVLGWCWLLSSYLGKLVSYHAAWFPAYIISEALTSSHRSGVN